MTIGIITFHWGTNYGAVLQAYALQQYLISCGHEVTIINYKPKKFDIYQPISFLKGLRSPWGLYKKILKERNIEKFRCNYLRQSTRFYTLNQLQMDAPVFDVYICGSDQIWNPSFLKHGEQGGSTAYFLDFGGNNISKIGYAVSFGTNNYPVELLQNIAQLIQKFKAISTRENSGVEILKNIYNKGTYVVPDPTLLLDVHSYCKLIIPSRRQHNNGYIFIYFLHGREKYIADLIKSKFSTYNIVSSSTEGVEDWLQNIKDSEYVITNSYHGLIFSLIFHKDFWVVLKETENIGMNDRFFTLLNRCNLLNRVISEVDLRNGKDFSTKECINWDEVDSTLLEYRKVGRTFLQQNL